MAARRNSIPSDVHATDADSLPGSEDLGRLALRAAAGDARAFELLVEQTSDTLVRLGARLMGSLPDGEDVVQEAYVKAYRGLIEGRFDGRAQVRTWLGRIVVNTAIDALRVRKRAPSPRDEAYEAVDASASAETLVALAELDDWLSALPPEQRAAVVLKSIEGHTSAEVADLLGCSEGAVEQKLVRARAALRQRMKS